MAREDDTQVRSYRDLIVWKQAMELAAVCYQKTNVFPATEAFGMTSQIRRSCASIPANNAEGNGRENTGSYIQFLRVAQGSLKELETHVLLARQVNLLVENDSADVLKRCEQVGKLLRGLIRSLQQKDARR